MKTDLFGTTFACACGKTHTIKPEKILYSGDALDQLPVLVAEIAPGKDIAVVMDRRTRSVSGETVTRIMETAGFSIQSIVVNDPEHGTPVCDDITRDSLSAEIADVCAMIAVGSGVVSDLTKWIAHERGIPYIAVGTAASMNGYASANVAPAIDGVKTLVRATPPYAVVATPEIIQAAPFELTAAGLGDILAKSVSSTDWKLNQILFGDYYCEEAVNLIADIEPLYLEDPEKIRNCEPEATEGLYNGLLLTGIAMTMAETSAPSSGGEHMVSHTLDMMSSVDGVDHDLHGRQVGIGTVLASELYRRTLAIDSPAPRQAPAEIDKSFWGRLAPVVAAHYKEKQPRLRKAKEKLSNPHVWQQVKEAILPMLRPPEVTLRCLKQAGGAYLPEHIGCSPDRLSAAWSHAHEIRSRFTILDLANIMGVIPEQNDAILDILA